MPPPARNTLAVIGAGPIGLEAALAALDAGFDVHVFERGEVGAHPLAWGHVRMFTPWRMNVGRHAAAHLGQEGVALARREDYPTGAELAERYLAPLGGLPELSGRVHTHSQVVSVSRRGLLKGDPRGEDPSVHPFRLLVRDQGGRENYLHACSLLDCSGVYGQPRWAGDGGIPARNELYLKPQLAYHLEDVLGLARARYAGRRSIVIGAGSTAATLVRDLARLADEAAGTSVVWATRKARDRVCAAIADDPLPERRALRATGRELAAGAHPAVTHVGDARVEGFEFNSATHRYRVTLIVGEQPRVEEVDQVLVAAGFSPDEGLHAELKVHACFSSGAAMRLAAALDAAGGSDCLTAPAFGAEALEHPEPDFYILGHKSYGRRSDFLLQTGFAQVADVIARLATRHGVGAPA